MPDIDEIWRRIQSHAGEAFPLYDRGEITYRVEDNKLFHSGTAPPIYRSTFEQALAQVPLANPGQLGTSVRGPSYVYAILMDRRIRQDDW